jgi:hypothetical protein
MYMKLFCSNEKIEEATLVKLTKPQSPSSEFLSDKQIFLNPPKECPHFMKHESSSPPQSKALLVLLGQEDEGNATLR